MVIDILMQFYQDWRYALEVNKRYSIKCMEGDSILMHGHINIQIIDVYSLIQYNSYMSLQFILTISLTALNIWTLYYEGQHPIFLGQAVYTAILILIISAIHQSSNPKYRPPKTTNTTATTTITTTTTTTTTATITPPTTTAPPPPPHTPPPPTTNQQKQCIVCHLVKPPRYYHCRECKYCIYRMDHHCFWLNCCVGQFNGKIYLQVLINFVIMCVSGIGVRAGNIGRGEGWVVNLFWIIFGIFGAFQAGRMMIGFIESIQNNQTLIETYKGVSGVIQSKSTLQLWMEVFGSPPNITWVMPTFAGLKYCNIFQETVPIKKLTEEYVYADEYIYGGDDEQFFLDEKTNQCVILKKKSSVKSNSISEKVE